MTRIGSIGSLSTNQLSALRRIQQLTQAITQNTTRLSTMRRINSAKDDPSGLIKASLLEMELTAAEQASKSVTRAHALLNTADAAAGEIADQLQSARALILEAASGTISSSEIAGNQIQVDAILRSVDRLSQTEFAGRRLLDGSSGFRTTGVDSATILDVDVLDKQTGDTVTVSIDVTTQALQATDSYTDGTLSSDSTLIVTGPDGTTTISLASGADTTDIETAFNDVSHLTGITATAIDGNRVDFATVDYGSEATITISDTEGSFTTTAGGTTAGTDAVATINGSEYTADGSSFNVFTANLSVVIELDPTANGTLTPFSVSGEGLQFSIGASPADTARVGLPKLNTASLGGVTGKLRSILSGGSNTLTGGQAVEALRIVDDALEDVNRSRAVIGGFQKFTLDSSSRVLSSTVENLSSSLSAIRDTDVAVETSLLLKNQLLLQSTLQSLSISNLQSQNLLSLLSTASRF